VTGLSLEVTDIASKRLEFLRNVVPSLHRLAIIGDVGYRASASELSEVQATARRLGLEVTPYEIRREEDIASILQALKPQADALYVLENALVVANINRIIAFTLTARLPTISLHPILFELAGSCPTGRTTKLFFGALAITLIRFCVVQNLATSRSSNRPNSIST
jgi:hypothetical protein